MSPIRANYLQKIVEQRRAGAIGGQQAQAVEGQQPQQATPQPTRRRRMTQGFAGRALLGGA